MAAISETVNLVDDVKSYQIILTPLAEQTAIVEYFDKATARQSTPPSPAPAAKST